LHGVFRGSQAPGPARSAAGRHRRGAGTQRAVETCFPRALRQRCLVHRLRNLRSKAPESQWPEIAIRARACYEAASPALAVLLRDDFGQAYGRDLPAVTQCFVDDFDACIAHLRFRSAIAR
jgi:putative transposase